MYIFFGDGYLGNQLFQYSFIKYHLKPKILLTTNFSALIDFIQDDKKIKIISVENKIIVFFLRRIFIFILKFLSLLRLINSILLETDRYKGTVIEGQKIIKRTGILPITFVFPHFFQNKKFHNNKSKNFIKIKKKYINLAQNFLKSLPTNNSKIIFLHVRLGQKTKHYYAPKDF